ncbi:MAG: AAA family ATPase [Bacteroidales bacterium]|nr:AAA family ATPase [Bacteroidales bacterium]MBR6898986.1 AAA family ATPase [Bacteroidales bacterium]
MARFLYDSDPRSAFLLRGYAGTGKTSLISALIQTLPSLRVSSLLLAPTGRAAKVISAYSNRPAYTIHKKIYMTVTDASGAVRTVRGINKHSYTLFIVDEASMIGLEPTSTRQSLLEDLIDYVYDGNHCRLMLIGDSAQLPPVGQSESPALDERYLSSAFSLNVISAELTEVVRQKQLSGILAGATALRSQITSLVAGDEARMPLFSPNGVDVIRLAGEDLMETLYREYGDFALDQVVVICRSNKRANLFNQGVRNTVLFREEEVNAGDYLMVVKNNYFWLDEESTIGFIANGDIVEVLSVRNVQELYGFRFADATVRFVDYPDEEPRDCKLLLSTLYSESPSLTSDEANLLFNNVMEDYADLPTKAERLRELRANPYFNALQVKFAYALTCHKTQGGQWRTVIIDQGFLPPDMQLDREYLRWLYTAFTRATDRVYLLNFEPRFYE